MAWLQPQPISVRHISMRLIRYHDDYRDPMLALHRGAIVGIPLGMSQQEDKADLISAYSCNARLFRTCAQRCFGHISQNLVAPAYQIVAVVRMWFWSSMIDCL